MYININIHIFIYYVNKWTYNIIMYLYVDFRPTLFIHMSINDTKKDSFDWNVTAY